MWNRKELKAKGKAALHANYWKCVLVAFLLVVFTYGGAGSGLRGNWNVPLDRQSSQSSESSESITDFNEFLESLENAGEGEQSIDELPAIVQDAAKSEMDAETWAVLMVLIAGFAIVLLIVLLISSLLKILVMNPLEVGCKSFFLRNSEAPASLDAIGVGFRDWGRNVKTMFLKDLFLFLWGLLLWVPGVVKRYSYRLVPYLMADNPDLQGTEAITLSRKLMKGHKWDAFVLDLSFLGWHLLSVLTLGLLDIFYVNPYARATDAELYRALRSAGGEDKM